MKATLLTIKFMPQWILNNQASGSAKIIDEILKQLNDSFKSEGVFVLHKNFQQCSLIIASDAVITCNEIAELLRKNFEVFAEKPDADITTRELDKDEIKAQLSDSQITLKQDNIDFLKKEFDLEIQEVVSPEKQVQEIGATTQKKVVSLDDMMSIEPLEKWVNETRMIAERFKDIITQSRVVQNNFFLISVNRGNGLSTILDIMADTLESTGLFRFTGSFKAREIPLSYTTRDDVFYRTLEHLGSMIANAQYKGEPFRGILALNISEWVDHLYDKFFDELMNFVWLHKNNIMFVFTIPYADDDVIEKLYTRLDDLVSTRVMKFVPPSDKQYFSFFGSCLNKFGISVNENAYQMFLYKVANERNDGRFYGFNTIKKIADEVLYQLILGAAQKEQDLPAEITAENIAGIFGIDLESSTSGLVALNNMVALQEVKDKVQEILATAKLQKELYQSGKTTIKPCYHMMFLGNPGTGKTVVARIIGRIFKEAGLLTTGNFFEVSRKDFIGEFVGQTAMKTMQLCRNAYGSVMFIDEAYLLASDDSYSDEAIGTLIAEMENKRDNMIVIFAGYEKDLERLFNKNTGLRDRIPHKIHFPNYNRDELKQIFFLQFKNKIEYDASFVQKADEYFASFPEEALQQQDFSNGRFVRNLAERIISKSAMRFEMSDAESKVFCLTFADFELAAIEQDFSKLFGKVRKVKKIGF